ncbi:MAG: exodeoxyribonuclease VII large subunit [Bacteroidetes bacterium GWF2_33_16]|nr:MAG: exodeoxyribonuclease VII large subunit [Bacteroidetes bacterium GWE2_32_14]OFY07904.1 MAG: exodeoxyribonuclease VII large subunit [Bacteroidetes bacterium GWF2_33_16]
MEQSISLLELNSSIKETLKQSFPDSVWVIAEVSELKINRNGHCYLELIEKDVINENIIARSRATIWAFTFRMLKPYFESITSQELSPGLKILFRASVEFHESYGLSLNIIDIDPNYTLGDLAKKRAETIKRLEAEGVINMNKELELPLVIQRIAIISSETAAGYQDFVNQLLNNSNKYVYYLKLFPSIMQGPQAEESIIQSLENIFDYEDCFDVVVIIRGGGSQADLNCFNNYTLASNVAQFPIPVLTGIGHDKDESVVDIVANTKLKTPTAVAEFIISKCIEFENRIDEISNSIFDEISEFLIHQRNNLGQLINLFSPQTKNLLLKEKNRLLQIKHVALNDISDSLKLLYLKIDRISNKIHLKSKEKLIYQKELLYSYNQKKHKQTQTFLRSKEYKLCFWESNLKLLDPKNILKRGYSITCFEGKAVKNSIDLNTNDEITTILYKGKIESKIK